MVDITNAKAAKYIEDIHDILKSDKNTYIAPEDLYKNANFDDLMLFTPEKLAQFAIHAKSEIDAWAKNINNKDSRIDITTIDKNIAIDQLGAQTELTTIAITTQNKPFLYDSLISEITASHSNIVLALHPILKLDDIDTPTSHIQIHLPKLDETAQDNLTGRIENVLKNVSYAVKDWQPMLTKLDDAIEELANHPLKRGKKQRNEAIAFLNWIRDNNFTFLGMREFKYNPKATRQKFKRAGDAGLGILQDADVKILRLGKDAVTSTPEILNFMAGPDNLIVTKANVRSVVHRHTYMDYVGIKRYDKKGEVCGELRIVGLFTSSAYTKSVRHTPLIREKTQKVITKFGYDENSHSGKALLNTLESYPRDELFQIDHKLLTEFCRLISDMEDRPRIRVLPRIDQFDRFVSILVYVPRSHYDSETRERMGIYLKSVYGDRISAYYPSFLGENIARVHFIIGRSGGKTPKIDRKLLEQDISKIITRWEDKFSALIERNAKTDQGHKELANRLTLNKAYQEHFSPEDAYSDLEDIAKSLDKNALGIKFYQHMNDLDGQIHVKIFHNGSALALSERVPLLENLGFEVVSEQTLEIGAKDEAGQPHTIIIHDMELEESGQDQIDLQTDKIRLEEAFLAIWQHKVDNDSFNRLVTVSGLNIRQTKVIRAYAHYLRQTGITYSQSYIATTLAKYPDITANIFKLFRNRFNPELTKIEREDTIHVLIAEIKAKLSEVPSLDDDQILRRMTNAITSTLRTNYFQRDEDGEAFPTLALKFNPQELSELPEPVPYREIFIYGAEVEGVHIRFGPVARGGLRWSDRAEDYRTEVLGLVKAQQVKNAVIVPVGSKGGFYPKKLPTGGTREDFTKAGKDAYKLFISTMLSITDNLDGDQIIPPKNTVRHDGDDPYFVVAADKGTATFSDTANAISQERDFWLDDAFASGGSAGYDHKKMGITAKGAWEAVKRHFREMNKDISREEFTVAGVGDMSGDVFGNGMLLSKKIRLIAAFDHRDIFIDPNPDSAKSFVERKRLFGLDRSSWQSYDKSILSKGGMIISRAEKSVSLTPEVTKLLNLSQNEATPHQILTAILKTPVELLWFGGIGTYIRDKSESNSDVGDRANDLIRVTAEEVGAKVIGEGANLGVTQKARITFAGLGGRCNSDAIDNSAGVNSSDVEVNIKIALANAMREERLTRPKRNKLLSAMTSNVSQLVLRNNYLQTLAISLIEQNSLAASGELARLMSVLENDGHLNRSVETLPDDQTLQDRLSSNKPLTRPEIGVLLSYAKIVLFDEIINTTLPDDPYFNETLKDYFPGKMHENFANDILTHQLRREIITTLLINDAINRGGPAFIVQMRDKTGASSEQILKSYIMVRDALGFDTLFDDIDKLDNKIDGMLQNKLYSKACHALTKATIWAIKTNATQQRQKTLDDIVVMLKNAIATMDVKLTSMLPDFMQDQITQQCAYLIEHKVPKALALKISSLESQILIPEIDQITRESKTDLDASAKVYFDVTKNLQIGRIVAASENVSVQNHYEQLALSRALDDISSARRMISLNILQAGSMDQKRARQISGQIEDLIQNGEISVAKLTVAAGLMTDLSRG